jgi:hypothetical protein
MGKANVDLAVMYLQLATGALDNVIHAYAAERIAEAMADLNFIRDNVDIFTPIDDKKPSTLTEVSTMYKEEIY